MSIADKLTTVAENVPKVFEAGKKSEYDAFWDALQDYGKRTDYSGFFRGGARNIADWFKPKYDIIPTSLYMFTHSNWTGLHDVDFVELFDSAGVKFDTSKCTDFQYAFGCGKRFGVIDTSSASRFDLQVFHYNDWLTTIDELIVHENLAFGTLTFQSCTALTHMIVRGTIGQNGFDVHWSTKLNRDSIESIVNALSTTTTGLSITLSSTAVTNAFGSIDNTEWTNLVATKPNWTISLV
jgi:hypothetical protein